MKLFSLFNKSRPVSNSSPQDAPNQVLADLSFRHSKGFRGFRRIPLATYQDDYALRGLNTLRRANPSDKPFCTDDRTIQLVAYINYTWASSPVRFLNVYVDGLKIGTFYEYDNEPLLDHIIAGRVDKVHVMINETDPNYFDNYVFVHIIE